MLPRTLSALLFFALLCGGAFSAPVANERCPVEPSELAVERYQTSYRGAVVSFCCADCITEFEKSPESYLDELGSMHFDEPPKERTSMQKRVDAVWNRAATTPGLALGGLALLALLLARFAVAKAAPRSRAAELLLSATGTRGLTILALLSLGGEALAAHLAHRQTRVDLVESELEHEIHYTVYQEYGDPPMPSRPDRPTTVAPVFYRGNDERNPALFNGGHYRTTTFFLDLCDPDGRAVAHGDECDLSELFLRVRFDRAPGTPDYFWTPERMKLIYATRDPGKFHGRFEAHTDAVPMTMTKAMQAWEFRYPLGDFVSTSPSGTLQGIVYQCERRLRGKSVIGGRFHYAFQFDLQTEGGRLSPESDLWMGALYRKRSLRIWEIPESQWLGTAPIPVIEGEQGTDDPKLLGIEGYEKNTN